MAETGVSVLAELSYQDPHAALAWLQRAFGFEVRLLVTDAEDRVVFSEAGLGEQTVAVVAEAPPHRLSPKSLNGANTSTIQITGLTDVDAHCATARAAGAVILDEPVSTAVGRIYLVADLEGHLWSFRQRLPGRPVDMPEGWKVRFPSRENAAD